MHLEGAKFRVSLLVPDVYIYTCVCAAGGSGKLINRIKISYLISFTY